MNTGLFSGFAGSTTRIGIRVVRAYTVTGTFAAGLASGTLAITSVMNTSKTFVLVTCALTTGVSSASFGVTAKLASASTVDWKAHASTGSNPNYEINFQVIEFY